MPKNVPCSVTFLVLFIQQKHSLFVRLFRKINSLNAPYSVAFKREFSMAIVPWSVTLSKENYSPTFYNVFEFMASSANGTTSCYIFACWGQPPIPQNDTISSLFAYYFSFHFAPFPLGKGPHFVPIFFQKKALIFVLNVITFQHKKRAIKPIGFRSKISQPKNPFCKSSRSPFF